MFTNKLKTDSIAEAVKKVMEQDSKSVEESSNPFSSDYKSQMPTKPGEKAGFKSKKISTGTVYSRVPPKSTGDDSDDGKKPKKEEYSFKDRLIDCFKEQKDTETLVLEKEMSDAQMKKRENIVMSMKDKSSYFKKKYGKRWKEVMYATATKQAMKEETEEVELDEELKGDMHPDAHKVLKHIKPEHHSVYKPFLKKGTYKGDYKDRAAVLSAAEKAGHVKEEFELDEELKGDMHPDAHKVLKHIKPEHHSVYKPFLKKGTYKGNYADRAAVLSAAEKAGHVKEEFELDEKVMGDTGWKKAKPKKDPHGNPVKRVARFLAKRGMKQAEKMKEEVEQIEEAKDDWEPVKTPTPPSKEVSDKLKAKHGKATADALQRISNAFAKVKKEEVELDEKTCVTPEKAKKIAHKEVGKHEKSMHKEEQNVEEKYYPAPFSSRQRGVFGGRSSWEKAADERDEPKKSKRPAPPRSSPGNYSWLSPHSSVKKEEIEIQEKADPTDRTTDMLSGRVKGGKDNDHKSYKIALKAEGKQPDGDNVPFVTSESKPLSMAKRVAHKAMGRIKKEMMGKTGTSE